MKRLIPFILFFAVHANAMNFQQIRGQARQLATNPLMARQIFTDREINDYINQGQQLAINQTWCLENNLTFQLEPGTTYYSVPSDFLAIRRLTLNALQLNQFTPAAMDGKSEGWQMASGQPVYYFIDFASANLVGFSPWPATSTDTGTISMDYYQSPKILINDSDLPYNGVIAMQQYGYILSYYAASQVAAMEGNSAMSTFDYSIFSAALTQMGARCKSIPNYLPSFTPSQ